MKKRIISLLIAISLMLGVTTGVWAQGLDNFIKTNEYTPGVFSDVKENAWYYQNVASAYSYGLANGVGEGQFAPEGNVTVAQAITFAVRIYQIYYDGTVADLTPNEGKWYDGYVSLALDKAIIENGIFSDFDQKASRAEIAYIFSRLLPEREYSVLNDKVSVIPDMRASEKFYNEILKLFRAGIITGMDEEGNYYPERNVTRAEITAIMDRIIDSSARKTFVPKDAVVTSTPAPETYNAEQISAMAADCVATVYVYNKKGDNFGLGSGFFIESNGVFVTNYHVIEDAHSAVLYVSETDQEYKVEKLLGCDEQNDIAVLKVADGTYKTLTLGDSDSAKNGQQVFVIGSPKGFANTITEGIISNTKRERDGQILMQISAPISSGNSGGPVLNNKCEVIGIATSSYVDGSSQNLNFAVHSNLISTVDRSNPMTLEEYQEYLEYVNAPEQIDPNKVKYYIENNIIPDFEYVTGDKFLEKKYIDDTVVYAYGYDFDSLNKYAEFIEQLGWKWIRDEERGETQYVYFKLGNEIMMIANAPSMIGIVFDLKADGYIAYSENSIVPDFEFITGKKSTYSQTNDGVVTYLYDYDYDALKKYTDYLEMTGWSHTSTDTKGDTQYICYKKKGELLMISNEKDAIGIVFSKR